jgi:hypothetical protein
MEYLELGPTPCDEPCAQTTQPDYDSRMRLEMIVYRHQLERMFPESTFKIKTFPHDFGYYGEVCVVYVEGTKSEEDAYHVESNLPEKWDDEALKELNLIAV